MTDQGGTTANPLLDELVTFIQHDLPGLDDGAYQLRIAQTVTDADGTPINDESLSQAYSFAVLGDRFRLKNPGAVLYSVFPPAGGSGEYTTVLPHVVFSKSTFPWSRYPTSQAPYAPPAPGQDTDADVPTWLYVLLLDQDDVAAYPSLSLTPGTATIADLFPTSLVSTSTLGSNYSYFWEAQGTTLDPGDQATDSIQVLDLPLPLFWKLAPTVADLRLMAHVREVSLTNKPTIPGISDVGEPVGTFSIVFGNRLPATERKTFAYLVSLEEMEHFLPTSEEGGAPSTGIDATKSIRLAVLASWSFYSTGQPATFVDQLLALNGGGTPAFTNLVLPYAGTSPVVRDALSMGFTPLNHDVRTGEHTVSWYRGPLAPYLVDAARVTLPVSSPDQATIFDPTTGMFDTSYSAAWTIGRLMALQDTAFSTALYTWKQGLSREVVDQVENGILSQAFGAVLQARDAVAADPAATAANARRSADAVGTGDALLTADAVPAAAPAPPRSAASRLLLGTLLSRKPPAQE